MTVLENNPSGLWLSELSRQSGLAESTITFYTDGILRDFIDNVGHQEEGKFVGIRVIKLKSDYLKGKSIDQLQQIFRNIDIVRSVK